MFLPEPPAPGDCRAYVRKEADTRSFRCGVIVGLDSGTYSGWIEAGDRISPHLETFELRGESDAVHELRWATVPAGTVAVSVTADAVSVDAIALLPANDTGAFFRRSSTLRDGHLQIAMPAGNVVLISRDELGNAVAVSEPTQIQPARTTRITLDTPARPAVLLRLDLPEGVETVVNTPLLTLDARANGAPDVVTRTDELLAIWYGVQEGGASVEGAGDRLYLPKTEVLVRRASIAEVRQSLQPLPSIRVSLLVTEAVELLGETSIVLERARDGKALRRSSLPADRFLVFENVPPEKLNVLAETGMWRFSRSTDLRSGADADVVFTLTPVVIEGRVTHGGDPIRATIKISAPKPLEVQTEDDGRYRMVLWKSGRYGISVSLPQKAGLAPFQDLVRFDHSRKFDIDIPKNTLRVRVRDTETGKGIAGAKVVFRSRLQDKEQGARSSLVTFTTDALGEATSPPVRDGTVEVSVAADQYDPATLSEMITRDAPDRTMDVSLRRTGVGRRFTIQLPNGIAATGAHVMVFALGDDRSRWSGQANDAGEIVLPNGLEGFAIVRHPGAATDIRDLRSTQDATWKLLAPAPPLELTVVDSAGRPVSGAHLALLVGGMQLTDRLLAAYSGFAGTSAVGGKWLLRNAPPLPIAIVATRSATHAHLRDGLLNHLAQAVPFPWPRDLQVTITD